MIASLRAAPIWLQVPLMFAAAPAVVALLGLPLAPLAVEVALAGESEHLTATAAAAVRVTVAAVLACAVIASAGAAILLRASIGTVLEQMQHATRAIANGGFRHRIASARHDELGQLAHAVDTMAARLECLEQARRRLLACVSHELRTPLTIVRGHAFTLARDEQDVARRERLALIEREAEHLAGLVDDLLDAACLQAGGVQLRPSSCDLRTLVKQSADRFRAHAAERDLSIEVRAPSRNVTASVDPARISQVLANLLGNALRHAAAGTCVTLDVAREAAFVAVSVRNAGAPIPARDRQRIFEPFAQLDGPTGRVGLGLSIARDLVVAHGGTLRLMPARREERVVEFRFTLPAQPARRVRTRRPRRRSAAGRPMPAREPAR